MSILNGTVSADVIHPTAMPYGRTLAESGFLPMKGAMDVSVLHAADGDYLVAACLHTLEIYRVGKDAQPTHTASLEGLGESRQLSVDGSFAYVTARPDSVYVCDLTDPAHPVLASRLDAMELATGVCAANGLLAVTNRHMGTDLYDVRDPYHPRWLSVFLCGEAQSVWLDGELALVGDWMNKRMRVFEISDPTEPREVSMGYVDGFADGVCSFKAGGRRVALIACGHHAARLKNRRKYQNYTYVTAEMLADGYGCGHGVELYDITDPRFPEYLASIKTPPLFGGIDSWRVFCDGETCYFTDSVNGLFAIDVRDVLDPAFLWHFRLPLLNRAPRPTPPMIQQLTGQIMGAAVIDGNVYAASPDDGVHILPAQAGELLLPRYTFPEVMAGKKPKAFFSCGAQVHSFAELDGRLYAACGEEGIAVLDIQSGTRLMQITTPDLCHDIVRAGKYLISAEAQAGAAVYLPDGVGLREVSRFTFGNQKSFREIVHWKDDLYGVLLGSNMTGAVKLSDDGKLTAVGSAAGAGLLYHRHLARTGMGGLLCTLSLSTGPALLSVGEDGIGQTGFCRRHESCPFDEGACGDGEKLLCVLDRKYACLDEPEQLNHVSDLLMPVEGAQLMGQPFLCGNTLVLLNRFTGTVELLDVSEPSKPVFVKRVETGSYPEFADLVRGELFVACGHGGIVRL